MSYKKYAQQVQLLLDVLPHVITENCFALKGGTAINFLIQPLPRLSVDIDLTYLPMHTRENAIEEICLALNRIKTRLIASKFIVSKVSSTQNEFKLFVRLESDLIVKIEVNPIVRGTVYPTEKRDTHHEIEAQFQRSVLDVPMLCMEELYGSKIVAALDRQHPRDLFDVHMLYETSGLTKKIRKAFIAYLLSSKKTHELLNPRLKNITQSYESQFRGMTNIPVSMQKLLSVRSSLLWDIKNGISHSEIKFITSFLRGEPKWELVELEHIKELPAIKWKLKNIDSMTLDKKMKAIQIFESSMD